MTVDWLFKTNHAVLSLALFLCLLAATELGFRLGRRVKRETDEVARAQLNAIEASMLAVLGLLVAFTFSMAGARYDSSRTESVNEANAIGTAYLRLDVMPAPLADAARPVFKEYVQLRLSFARFQSDVAAAKQARERELQLQSDLWRIAVAAVREEPSATGPVLLTSFNDMIDAQASHDAALAGRVPSIILIMLFLASIAAMGSVGAACSMGSVRNFPSTALFSLLIVLVVFVILDLDRPYRGVIRLQQTAMTDLLESMK